MKEWRNERLLGKTFLDRQGEIVLRIGKDGWTRQELVEQFKCGNFVAARILSHAAEALGVESAKQMASRVTLEDLFSQDRVGITTVYTWMCILEGLNKDPFKWLDRDEDNMVTLTTEKKHLKEKESK